MGISLTTHIHLYSNNVSAPKRTKDSIHHVQTYSFCLGAAERKQLLVEIDKLIHTPPDKVPEESKFLLEIDFARLRRADNTEQNYWVHAIKAAVKAGRRKGFLRRRRTASRTRNRTGTCTPHIPYGPNDEPDRSIAQVIQKRQHDGTGSTDDKSNKRRRPD